MRNINIALFACLLLALQISCTKKESDQSADPLDVTLLAEDGRGPAWSPNGKEIAYIYGDILYLMNSDGSNKRKLESDLYNYPAIWSPSGDYMLYIGFSTRWELNRIDANGDNKTSLCGVTTKPHHASWSPDGQKIAFTTWEPTLSVMNADGTNLYTLIADVNTWITPCWSPDMNRLLFTMGYDDDRDMYLINSDGSDLIRIAIDTVYEADYVQFSIDGTKVFFRGSHTLLGGSDIFSVNCDGSGLTNLTSDVLGGGSPQLSPDGTKVAFISSLNGEDAALCIMATDGSGKQQLTKQVEVVGGISWSPDGKEIAFCVSQDYKTGIYSIRVPQ